MIKEKTIYHSTVTGEDYLLLEDAVNAENGDSKPFITTITEFCNTYKLYNDELRSINRELESNLANRISEIHQKYNPIFNVLAEKLHSMGFDVSNFIDINNELLKKYNFTDLNTYVPKTVRVHVKRKLK